MLDNIEQEMNTSNCFANLKPFDGTSAFNDHMKGISTKLNFFKSHFALMPSVTGTKLKFYFNSFGINYDNEKTEFEQMCRDAINESENLRKK